MTANLHPIRQMIEGLTYVRRRRFLLGAITLDLFAVLLGGATAMLPVFARDILFMSGTGRTQGLGLMRGAPADRRRARRRCLRVPARSSTMSGSRCCGASRPSAP